MYVSEADLEKAKKRNKRGSTVTGGKQERVPNQSMNTSQKNELGNSKSEV